MAPPDKRALLRAEESIQATLAQADRVVTLTDATGRAAHHELLSVLEAADLEVAKRLLKISPKPNGELRFTAAQAISSRLQIQLVIEKTKLKLDPTITGAGTAAMDKAIASGAQILAKLEKEFKGATVSPNILAAMQQSHVLRGPKAALVTSVATSLDRYGHEMGQQFSRIIQVGLVSGATNDQMLAALIAHGGPRGRVSLAAKETAPGVVQRIREGDIPEGLFTRHKFWAERIIRTEVAYAFNGAKLEQLRQMRTDGLHVLKKICAHFDSRTAADSVAVHGQIRELEQLFTDGAGRQYIQPPGRPNDRETILPWFDDWAEVPSTEPPSQEEIDRAKELSQPGGDHVTPPATVQELDQVKDKAKEALELPPVPDPETAAAERLLALERERIRSAQALAQRLEDERKAAEAAKAKLVIDKLDKQLVKDFKKTPHEAALDLYRVAVESPEKFARLYARKRPTAALPEDVFTKGALKEHDVLDALVRDVLGSYGDPDLLTKFKKSAAFHPFLEKLELATDARSRQLLAGLTFSEKALAQPNTAQGLIPWKLAADRIKKLPDWRQSLFSKLRATYRPPDDHATKYRALYGPLADRIGAAELRMLSALKMTVAEALEVAKGLPGETGTRFFLEGLTKHGRRNMISVRDLPDDATLEQLAKAAEQGGHLHGEIHGHASLLGHVKDLETGDSKRLHLKPHKATLTEYFKTQPEAVQSTLDSMERGASALGKLLHKDVGVDAPAAGPDSWIGQGEIGFPTRTNGRAYASHFGLAITPNESVSVVAHEYSHLIAFRNQHLWKSEQAFLAARTAGKGRARPLNEIMKSTRFNADERAWEAGFLSPYTSKDYKQTGATTSSSNEVTAMGSTHIFDCDVGELWRKDPAHLFFTLSQYRGGR
jgi:hypothetical protein